MNCSRHLADFNELKVGDFVVHETHGLGIYRGIEKVEMEKVVTDELPKTRKVLNAAALTYVAAAASSIC